MVGGAKKKIGRLLGYWGGGAWKALAKESKGGWGQGELWSGKSLRKKNKRQPTKKKREKKARREMPKRKKEERVNK